MNWLFTTIICIFLVELLRLVPLVKIITDMNLLARKALHVLSSKSISDHWKEKAILAYSSSLFLETLKLAVVFLTVGLLVVVLIFVFEYFDTKIGSFIISVSGSLYSIIIASLYLIVRKYFV